MDKDKSLRAHLLELLDGESAHISLESVMGGFPVEKINRRIGDSHSAWELLEHIRIAQWDILDFSTNPKYKEMEWPDDYWPKENGTPQAWADSVEQVLADLQAMRDLVADESIDLHAPIPHGSGQTVLREAMLIADHNAYHLGQLVLLGK